jgi:hypothetical protein
LNMIHKFAMLALTTLLILSGCNFQGFAAPTATIDNNLILTAAAATAFVRLTGIAGMATATSVSTPTATPEPPTLTLSPTVEVTLEPVDAICTANAQVRSWPGSGSETYGGVFLNQGIKVLARNLSGMWFLMNFADSPTGTGWVRSSAFKLKGDVGLLPIALEVGGTQLVFIAPPVWSVTGTPLPLPTISNDPAARPATVVQQAKVRVCPTTSCLVIGLLNIGDQISMTGRMGQNEWAQFLYPSGPNGKGWVSRQLIEPSAAAFGGLPYFDMLGNLITPVPPTSTPDPNMSPTPSNTASPTAAGPLAEITDVTTVYTLQSSLSPVLGTLNPKDRIHITLQSLNHLWFQIQYPAGTTGRGYISSKYVRLLGDFRNLPYSDANGTPIP